MPSSDQVTVMQRKSGAGRPPPEIAPASLSSVMRNVVMRAGEEQAGLVAMATEVVEARQVISGLGKILPENCLLALVEGPDSCFGLIAADNELLTALIEIHTTGRVSDREVEPRAPTKTDAAICADFFDNVLEELEQLSTEAGLETAPALAGFRFAAAVEDQRALIMSLEEIPYREIRVTMDLGQGARSGLMILLLPYETSSSGASHRAVSSSGGGAASKPPEVVMDLPVHLDAVIHRLSLTLADVTRLEVGATLPIPLDRLGKIVLRDMTGSDIARARLGQQGGNRAVRIGAGGVEEPASAISLSGADLPVAGLSSDAAPDLGIGSAPPLDLPSETEELSPLDLPAPDALPPIDLNLSGTAELPDLPDIAEPLPDLADLTS